MTGLLFYAIVALLLIELSHPARRRGVSQNGLVVFTGVTWFIGGAMAALSVPVGLITGGAAAAMTAFASVPRSERPAPTMG